MPAEDPVSAGSDFRLIETLGWYPGTGFSRLDRHLARLALSAAALGFHHNPAAVRSALSEAVAGATSGGFRVRLTLDRGGGIYVAAVPLAPLPPGAVWRAAFARHRLGSGDPLLAHKTSRRAFYDETRTEVVRRYGADEALFLNERGDLCEGGITNLFVECGGVLLTPPISCGLLPGCLREELLEIGRAREAVLTPADLARAPRWFLGNSLRGLIPARLLQFV